jgi:hypothetical protein
MATLTLTVNGCKFDVAHYWDNTLTSYPVQFIYYQGRRVGLFDRDDDNDTIYFDSVTMFELFGPEFNADNFGIGITFGRFDRGGLSNEEYNRQKNETNVMLKSADEVFKMYLDKEIYNKNNAL